MPETFIVFPCQYTQAAWDWFLYGIDFCDVLNFSIPSSVSSKILPVGDIRNFNPVLNTYQKYSLICLKDWNSTLTVNFTDHSASDRYLSSTWRYLIKLCFPENNFTQEKLWSFVTHLVIHFITASWEHLMSTSLILQNWNTISFQKLDLEVGSNSLIFT